MPNLRVGSTVFELVMLLQYVTAEGLETITAGLNRLDSKSIDESS